MLRELSIHWAIISDSLFHSNIYNSSGKYLANPAKPVCHAFKLCTIFLTFVLSHFSAGIYMSLRNVYLSCYNIGSLTFSNISSYAASLRARRAIICDSLTLPDFAIVFLDLSTIRICASETLIKTYLRDLHLVNFVGFTISISAWDRELADACR